MRPIDADALNMYLCELQMANLGEDDDYCETLNEVIHIVDQQPTILAETVKHGEWTVIEDDYVGLTHIECSLCHEEWCFEVDPGELDLVNYNYCPNCGADMRERKENGI